MLQNFSSEIISKMDAKLIENEEQRLQNRIARNGDDEISPIVRQNSVNNNDDDNVAKRLNVRQQEVSFCDLSNDFEVDDDEEERQRNLREQIEKDHQVIFVIKIFRLLIYLM